MKLFKNDEFRSFFFNFLAVVLGIVITFSGEGLISSRQEKENVKSSLNFVKNELLDNLEYINFADTVLNEYRDAARFLIRYEGRYYDAPADTLYDICNIPLSSVTLETSEEALELLKNSGAFTKIKDMDLALDIIHTYTNINLVLRSFNTISSKKDQYLNAALTDNAKKVLSGSNVTAAALWTAITSTIEGKQFLRELYRLQVYHESESTRQTIQETIDKIDAYLK